MGPGRCGAKVNSSACGVDVVAVPQSRRKDSPGEGLCTREGGLGLFSCLAYIHAVTLIRGGATGPAGCQRHQDRVGLYPRCSRCFRSMMYAARCAAFAIASVFGRLASARFEIRRRALSGQQPCWLEGGLRRRPVPALGVSSRTVRRPRAAGLFFATSFMADAGGPTCRASVSSSAGPAIAGHRIRARWRPNTSKAIVGARKPGQGMQWALARPRANNRPSAIARSGRRAPWR